MSRVVRPHTKSRRGCHCCKRRRVKCDLVEPRCGNCVRLGMTCSFEGPTPPLEGPSKVAIPRIRTPRPSGDSQAQEQDVNAITPMTYPIYRGQDLEEFEPQSQERRLFSYYMRQSQSESNPSNMFMHRFLGDMIPTLSFEFRFVMDILLSVCSAAFRMHNLGDPGRLAGMCHDYMGRAISGQSAEIVAGVDRRNFEAVYITAILIAVSTVVQHQFLPAEADRAEDLGNCIVQWLRAFRGVRTVVVASGAAFAQSRLAAVFPAGGWQNPAVDLKPGDDEFVFGFLLAELEAEEARDERYAAYHHAAAYFSTVYQRPSRQLCMRFLSEARPEFVASVDAGEPLALLLMAVYFALTRLAQAAPILDKSAERDLAAITRHLSPYHRLLLDRSLALVAANPLYRGPRDSSPSAEQALAGEASASASADAVQAS